MSTAVPPRLTGRAPSADGVHPVFDPLARLSGLAADLAVRPLGPRPDFAAALRLRLVDEYRSTLPVAARADDDRADKAEPPRRLGHARPIVRQRFGRTGARVAAGAVALSLAATGVTAAAAVESALPGDPLYGIKRATEAVGFAISPASSTQIDLRRVSLRLAEAQRLAHPGSTRWADFDRAVDDAQAALLRVAAGPTDAATAAALAADRAQLSGLASVVPGVPRSDVLYAIAVIDSLGPVPTTQATPLYPASMTAPTATPGWPLAAGWPVELIRGAVPATPTAVGADGSQLGSSTSRPAGRSGATGAVTGASSTGTHSPTTSFRPAGSGNQGSGTQGSGNQGGGGTLRVVRRVLPPSADRSGPSSPSNTLLPLPATSLSNSLPDLPGGSLPGGSLPGLPTLPAGALPGLPLGSSSSHS